jgi:eukaryotic-like serine/threonine-protein kinase
MYCTHCGAGLPDRAGFCPACGRSTGSGVTVLGDDQTLGASPGVPTLGTPVPPAGTPAPEDVTSGVTSGDPDQMTRPGTSPGWRSIADTGPLAPGTAFGTRYHIIRLLGMGGMGAVYQAWDDALGEAVALKVIRPEVTADPAVARDVERRFKRELQLARQVTHKNVVRIHDLGEIDGIKYLTMPYVQGSDLASILRKEVRLPVPRAVALMRQVVDGLCAAHEAGVIHRDLKPANIMVDADDHALIMDFGISRSVSGGGATVAGAVVGTLEYMAPEQAMARPVDHRADIYAIGLILYDLVLGPRQASRAESAVAELMARVQKPLPPARSIDPSIPEALEQIISHCTEPDAFARYQTTAQLAADLAALDDSGRQRSGTGALTAPLVTPAPPPAAPPTASKTSKPMWAAAAAVLLVLAVSAAWLWRGRGGEAGAPAPRVAALAVLPFHAATPDPTIDWLGPALAEMIRADVGQSERLRLVSSERVIQLSRDLGLASRSDVPVTLLRQFADFSSADTVVSGRYMKLGEQIRIEATLQRPNASGDRPVALAATAAGEDDLLRAAEEIARGIQENLSLDAAAIGELRARAFKPSSTSVQALRHYNEGVQRAAAGEQQEAAQQFEAAIAADSSFALAYSRLAQAYAAQGRAADAEKTSRQALDLSASLPPEEHDMIAGANALITGDVDAAIASYERLLQARPADTQLRYELARLYERKGQLDRAQAELAKVLAAEPKHVDALYWAGRVAIGRRDYQASLEPLTTALNLSVQLDNNEAKANLLQALGIAYKRLNKLDDALRQYQQSLDIKRRINDRRGIAASLSEIAQIQNLQGHPGEAVTSYRESIEIRREIGDRPGTGIALTSLGAAYLDGGRYPEALDAFREALQIQRDLGDDERQARCLSNIGIVYYSQASYEEARTYLERALELREKIKVPGNIALTLTSLADVLQKQGDFARAQAHYLRALDLWREEGDERGRSTTAFAMATLLEQQGRYGAALEAKSQAVTSYRELQERSAAFAEVLVGYGQSLGFVGRFAEAEPVLGEALALVDGLGNKSLLAQTLNVQGDNAYFRGDLQAGAGLYERAAQAAKEGNSRYDALVAGVNAARVAVEGTAPADAAARLKRLTAEADDLGAKPLAAQSAAYAGLALLRAKQVGAAATQLQAALTRVDRLEARPLQALVHSWLADLAGLQGKPDVEAIQRRDARRLFGEMQEDAKGERLSARYDFRVFADPSN